MQVNHLFKRSSKKLKKWRGILISPLLVFGEERLKDYGDIRDSEEYKKYVKDRIEHPREYRLKLAVKLMKLLRNLSGRDDNYYQYIKTISYLIEDGTEIEHTTNILLPNIAYIPKLYYSQHIEELGIKINRTRDYVLGLSRTSKYFETRFDEYVLEFPKGDDVDHHHRKIIGNTCLICETSHELTTHHIFPRRYGGTNHSLNMATMCSSCHNQDQSIEVIIQKYERIADALDIKPTGAEISLILYNTKMLIHLLSHIDQDEEGEEIALMLITERLVDMLERRDIF